MSEALSFIYALNNNLSSTRINIYTHNLPVIKFHLRIFGKKKRKKNAKFKEIYGDV